MNKLHLILVMAWIAGHPTKAFTQTDACSIQSQQDRSAGKEVYVLSPTTEKDSKPNVQSIRMLLEQAQAQLTEENLPRLEPARSELEASLTLLEQFIGVDPQNGELWSNFLRIPEIRQQLESKTPLYFDLLELEMNMRQNFLGLEYPQFVRLRNALRKFSFAARFYKQESGFIKSMTQNLQNTLQLLDGSDSVDDKLRQELVAIASNLYQSGQAENQLQQLLAMFGSQNVYVTVNESFVSRLGARPVSRPQDVNECILGTRILGTAYMNGDISLSLIPMTNGVGLQLDLSACLSSRNRGYNRGVALTSSSSSPVLASKQLFISSDRLSSIPAVVSTQLNSTIHSIEHRSGLVRKIARKKAAQQKPLADAIAEGRMQSRIEQQFNAEVEQQASQAQSRLTELRQRPIPEIDRLGFVVPPIGINSTSSLVLAGAVFAEPYQLSATGGCPLTRPADASIVGEIHESALCNGLAVIMAARTIRNTSLGDFVRQVNGRITEELQSEIEGEEWSITFNNNQPVRIEFDDEMIAITVRLIRMTRGKQILKESLSITTKYIPQLVGDRLTLTRQGEVAVTSEKVESGTIQSVMRSFVKSKFDKIFRESFVTEPLTLSKLQARLPPESNLRLDIKRVTFRIDQGWLQVAVPL